MKIPPFFLGAIPLLGTAVVGFIAASSVARAETIYGLASSGDAGYSLVSFDSATPGTNLSSVIISGIAGGLKPSSIDFRSANGQLYAVTIPSTGAQADPVAQLYTINTATGLATAVGSGFALTGSSAAGLNVGIDFNPVVDRLRVVAHSTATEAGYAGNYRVNPTTGGLVSMDTALVYASGDANAGSNVDVKGIAYTNSGFGASAITTLYGYDFNTDVIATIGSLNGTPNSPNGGLLNTIGSSGIGALTEDIGFDISGATGIGYLSADVEIAARGSGKSTDPLFTVDLATGTVTFAGFFDSANSSLIDIAVPVPEPSASALAGMGLICGAVGMTVRRMRRRTA